MGRGDEVHEQKTTPSTVIMKDADDRPTETLVEHIGEGKMPTAYIMRSRNSANQWYRLH